jgi:hypothetical protein
MADESLKDLKERAKIQSQILETLLAQGKTKSEQDDIKQTKAYRSQLEIYKNLNEEIKNFKNQTADISNTLSESADLIIDQQDSLKSLSGIQLGFKRDTEKIVKAQTDYLSINSSILDSTEKIQSNITNSLGKYGDITTQLEDANDEERQRYDQASRILQLQDDLSNATKRQDRDLILSQLQGELVSFGDLIKNSNDYSNNLKDIQTTMGDISSMQAGPAFVDEEVFKLMSDINDISRELSELSKEDSVARERMLLNLEDSLSALKSYGIVSDDILQSLENQKAEAARISNLTEDQKDRLESQIDVYDGIKDSIGGVLNTIGTLFSGIRGFISGTLIGLGTVVNKLGEMNQSLGLSLLDTGEMQLSALGLGLAFKDADAIATGLAEKFGSMEKASFGLQLQTNLMATNLGISGDEAIDLTKSFSMLNNSSTDIAADMIKSTQQTAKMAGVVPSKVMKDLAKSTEAFALYGKDGGKNIAEAAVYAAKLGTEMDTLTGITDKLLDFENSITDELELSAMLGKNINLNRARQLAYEGKIEESIGETLNQLGGIEAFNKMDYYQKKQTAELLGVSVGEFQKMAEQQSKMGEDVGFFQEKWSTLTESLTAFGNTLAGTILQGAGGFLVQLGQINMGLSAMGVNLAGIIKKMLTWLAMPFKAIGSGIAKMFGGGVKAASDLTDSVTEKAKKVDMADTKMKKPQMGSKLTDLSNGLSSMGTGKVLFGALNLIPTALGFVAMLPAIPAIFFLSKIDISKIGVGLASMAIGLTAMGTGKVSFGAANLVATGIGFSIMTLGAIGMGIIALLGAPLGAGLSALSAGLTTMGSPSIFKGAIGLALIGAALIPFTFALSLLQGVDAGVILATVGSFVILGIAAAAIGAAFPLIAMGALGITLIGLSLIPFTFALSQLKSVDPNILLTTAISLAAFAGTAALIGMVSPLIISGSSAIVILSLALIPFGYALSYITPMIEIFANTITKMFSTIPQIIQSVTDGLVKLSSIDASGFINLGIGLVALGGSISALGLMLPTIMLGVGSIMILNSVLPIFAQNLLALASVNGENLSLIGTSMYQIGMGSIMAATGMMASIGAISVLATILPILILLGSAFMLFGFGLERAANASNMLSQSLPIISQSIQQLASSVESIDLLSESISRLASNLSKLSFASILAAPAMIALKLFATPSENVQQTQTGQEEIDKNSILEQAIRETNEMLLMEIKGLREDLNSGKISVNMDGDSVTSKIVKNINRSASNSYGLKGA